jgi:PKD repeat protein
LPVMRIIDAETGLSSLTLGNPYSPMPVGGYKFTVNVTLENVDGLFDYEVAVKYNASTVNCTDATINKLDPTYVFYQIPGGSILVPTYFNTNPSYVAIGASALTSTASVSSPRLLCQLSFAALRIGTWSLEFILVPPTLNDQSTFIQKLDSGYFQPYDVPFSAVNLTVTVEGELVAPVAGFTFEPDQPEPLQNVTFDASASYSVDGTIVSYTWDFGDGSSETSVNPMVEHSFLGGVFSVTLTVVDDYGLFDSTEKVVGIGIRLPVASFTWSVLYPDDELHVVFDGSASHVGEGSSAVIVSWEWDFGDSSPPLNESNSFVAHDYASVGTYVVKLTVYDSNGLQNSAAQYVTTQYIAEYQPLAFLSILAVLSAFILLVAKRRKSKLRLF